ncbi:putative GTD-binding domain-containing protein [Helianthus annuus]|nr:putative GTD-binding domain-containing protein [Helianthus annuus]
MYGGGNMESESTSMVKCCDCGCSNHDPGNGSYSGTTWLRSVKRKVDGSEEDGDKFVIPGLVIPSVARVEIENECNALREMVSNQQLTIQDLISDLEEERYASSSAANEAMSMILKLQREKAEVQMEARQFKRFSEEKMAHDQQELMALEDLLYRREQSIQSLTCEVQAYKHRMISYGLTESEADGEQNFMTRENSIAKNLESQFDFASYDYPPLKCNNLNENRAYPDNDNETVDIENPKESSSRNGIEDPEVKKLYARLHALEADRESMRQALISMRTDKAQLVLLKEIAQQLCKEMPASNKAHAKKPYNGVGSSFFSVFKWIASFGFLGRKEQRNKHIFIALASSAGLLMLLDKRPQIGQWRCLSSTSLKK